jgi:peptidoglycan/LPS O-acetylase OafA/YrhL
MPRVTALDGLRGLAILGVLVTHHGMSLPPTLPAHLFEGVASIGSTGVDLFFVLSGYLITAGLLLTKGKELYFRAFYWRRALRILPVAYLVLVALMLTTPAPVKGQEWAYWLFLGNWVQGLSGHPPGYGFSVFWSLAIEEQFYLVWPAVILLTPRRRLLHIAAGLAVGALLARLVAATVGVSPFTIYVLTPFRLDGLAIGAMIAILGPSRLAPLAKPVAGVTFMLLAAVFVLTGEMPLTAAWFQPVGYSVVTLFFGALLILCIESRLTARVFESRLLVTFGTFSYALYLVHDPLRIPIHFVLPSATPPVVEMMVWLCAAFGVGLLSWRYLEAPLLRLKGVVPTMPVGGSPASGELIASSG